MSVQLWWYTRPPGTVVSAVGVLVPIWKWAVGAGVADANAATDIEATAAMAAARMILFKGMLPVVVLRSAQISPAVLHVGVAELLCSMSGVACLFGL